MRIEFADGDEEYGVDFIAERGYESLPSIRFNGIDRLRVGLSDDDMGTELRDVLNKRFPTNERAELANAIADKMSDLELDALEGIRSAEAVGNESLARRYRAEYSTLVKVAVALDEVV